MPDRSAEASWVQEKTAVLVHDHGEWILVTDDNGPERVSQDPNAAIEEVRLDGWTVAEGPAPIRPSIAGLERFDLLGYSLRRCVQ